MKTRKVNELDKAFCTKGFEKKESHHTMYVLCIEGEKQGIHTYLSHGKKEYPANLMSKIKKQLKFIDNEKFEKYIDCTFTLQNYIDMLKENGIVNK